MHNTAAAAAFLKTRNIEMSKANKRAFNKMREKIKESKRIAEQEAKAMRYNSKPLEITCSTPASDITWATKH